MIDLNKCWVVTSSDSRAYESMLVPFLASIRDVAKWAGKIAVVDYGLTDGQLQKLKELGIIIFKKANHYRSLVCDRYFSVYDAMSDNDLYAIIDADIWFNESIDDLFENYDNKLHCTVDCNYQGFIIGVITDETIRAKYKQLIAEKVLPLNNGKPLQAGFIFSNKEALGKFTKTIDFIINNKIADDTFGTETLALQVFFANEPDAFNVGDIRYNCIPDWRPAKIGNRFVFEGEIIRAIHRTSPYRSNNEWAFATYHPDINSRWQTSMFVLPSETETVVVKGNKFAVRKGTWDHTILYHDDYQVLKHIVIPEDGCFVDIGSHIGGFTKLVATEFPNVPVFSFEPNPLNFALLKQNTDGLKNVFNYQCGVGSSDAKGKLINRDPINTGMYQLIDGGSDAYIISPETFFNIIGNRQIVFMKIDCEGGEWAFFDKLTATHKNRIWEIQGELHTDYYHYYQPFAKHPAWDQPFLRKLLAGMFPNFVIFLDGCRIIKAYNKAHVL
jgi:FkbM family methyltransferase